MKKLLSIITAGLLLPLMTACASSKFKGVKLHKTTYVALVDVARYYGMKLAINKNNYVIYSKWTRFSCVKDKKDAVLNKVNVHLSFAPTTYKGKPMISGSDFLTFLDPMIRSKSMKKKNVRRILIDPGHGGKDPGAKGKYYKEKHVALEVSKKLRSALRARGFEVFMTRTGDSYPTLEARAKYAGKIKADLLLSIHANAAAKTVHGVETFTLAPKGTPSTSSKTNKKKATPGNKHDKENSRISFEVQKALLKYTRAKDRGVRHAQFKVLVESPVPATLIELGFLSNAKEERLLGSKAYQAKLVAALTEAVVNYRKAKAAGY